VFRVLLMVAACAVALTATAKEPVDYVNTGIGTISHLLVPCFRTLQLPNGMFRFLPPEHDFVQDRVGTMMLQYPGHRSGGVTGWYPYSGPKARIFDPWSSSWDQEHSTPYSYDVVFDDFDLRLSMVPTARGALAGFEFRRSDEVHAVVFREDEIRPSEDGRRFVMRGGFEGAPVWFVGEFDRPPQSVERRDNLEAFVFGRDVGRVALRLAVSYIGEEQAAANLRAEIPHWDAAALIAAGRAAWNAKLGRIEVEGGTDDQRTVFYTALWRTYERMVNVTEDGHYRGWDGAVHPTDGIDYYVDDWIWDSFRAHHPLMVILEPTAEAAKLTSYIRMSQQDATRWMPTFPSLAGDQHRMVNHHVAISFYDAWVKGVRCFDLAAAFRAMDHTERTESLIPWHRGPQTELDRFHDEHGYFPALPPGTRESCREVGGELRQAVSVTQGSSYDAWALSQIASVLGDATNAAHYARRARNYRNLWDAETRFFRPRDARGEFIRPFDPVRCGGHGARKYFTENNAWTYIWDVQHDLAGLRELLGGERAMERRLDEMFNTGVGCRWEYVAAMPDGSTGMMGNFTMANEPSFHIPYLYNLAGVPWKTQKLVRKTLEAWFRNDRMGMCGDEDGGGMSAYAVFSMMGFYPVTPGKPEYQWGSPVFTKVTIHLENGRDFVLEAPASSIDAKYVKDIEIDGRHTDALTPLAHADIVAGRRVRLEMSATH